MIITLMYGRVTHPSTCQHHLAVQVSCGRLRFFSSMRPLSVQMDPSSRRERSTGRQSHHDHCTDPFSTRAVGNNCATKHAHPLREAHKRPSQSWPPSTPMPPPRSRSGEPKLRCPSTRKCGSLEHCRKQPSHAAHADVMATIQLVARLMPAHPHRCQGKTRQRPVRSGWQVKWKV